MDFTTLRRRNGFSLVELVIVIVIISAIAAIAVPRLTRGASNAGSAALKADLAVLRNAIELYRAEHEGAFPALASVTDQLTSYTDINGANAAATANVATGVIYGPYLKEVPKVPVGTYKDETAISSSAGAGVGWVYDESTGNVTASATATDVDQDGTKYNTY